MGNAVRRHRVKRLVREAFRHLRHDLPAMDFVVVVRPHDDEPAGTYRDLLAKLAGRLQ